MKFHFKSIPKICINLKRNEARKLAVTQEFKKHNIHNVEFFEAIDKHNIVVPEISQKRVTNIGHAEGYAASKAC